MRSSPVFLSSLALLACRSSADSDTDFAVLDLPCWDTLCPDSDSDSDSDSDTDSDTDSDADTDTTADTGTTTTAPTADTGAQATTTADTGAQATTTVAASCTRSAQPLVFECTVTLSAPGPATLAFAAAGAPTRTFTSDGPAVDHVIYGWGLLPTTTYDWDAGSGVVGQATTGGLPADLRGATITATGTLFGADAVLVYVKCGYFVMIDSDGRIVWYLPTTVYDSFVDGMRWSQVDRSVVTLTDSTMTFDTSEVAEHHITGTQLLHLRRADFALDLTHDLDRWNGYTYLLGERGNGVGGLEVFQGTTKLGEWSLTDGFPGVGGLNTAHVNGLTVSDTGTIVLSSLNFNALIGIDGDPSSPTFLQMSWHANGSPGGMGDLPNPDFTPATGTIYRGQHNGSLHGDELWVFDNRSQNHSRALRMHMDLATGTLSEIDSWSVGQVCPNQGGSLPLPGGALVTCANQDDVYAFRDGANNADWELHTSCGFPGGGSSTRAYPVTFE